MATFLPVVGVVVVSLLARLVPWRRLPPRATVWGMTAIATVASTTALVALAVLAGGYLLGTPAGAWLVEACSLFAAHHRIPGFVGLTALSGTGMIAWRVAIVASNARSTRLGDVDPLTVLTAEAPIAYARSGRHGGVIVSTGMLAALEPAERRVLFAHERAHVRARHDLHLLLLELAVAVLPWLARLRPELCLAVESEADAAALAEVRGDRRLVATAIARAAIAFDEHGGRAPAVAFTGGAVAFRVQSMLDPSDRAPLQTSVSGLLAMCATLASTLFVHHVATLLRHVCF